MYCIQWAMMRSDYLLNSMPLSMAFTLRFQQKITSIPFDGNWIISVLVLIGAGKFERVIRSITNGLNGSFFNSLIAGSIVVRKRLNELRLSLKFSREKVINTMNFPM